MLVGCYRSHKGERERLSRLFGTKHVFHLTSFNSIVIWDGEFIVLARPTNNLDASFGDLAICHLTSFQVDMVASGLVSRLPTFSNGIIKKKKKREPHLCVDHGKSLVQ